MAFQQYNFKSHRLIHAAIKALENVCCRWGWSKNTELDHSIGRKKDLFSPGHLGIGEREKSKTVEKQADVIWRSVLWGSEPIQAVLIDREVGALAQGSCLLGGG